MSAKMCVVFNWRVIFSWYNIPPRTNRNKLRKISQWCTQVFKILCCSLHCWGDGMQRSTKKPPWKVQQTPLWKPVKTIPPKISWFKLVCGFRNFSWVVTSSKNCWTCVFFPLNLNWFCWFIKTLLILKTKETLNASTLVQVWLLLCLNRIFDSQKRSLVCKMTLYDLRFERCTPWW